MNTKEAKDFLVWQTLEQACLDGVPLSDLERRMMYYMEGPEATEADTRLNEEFDAHFNTVEYERKIGSLLRHAYSRLQEKDPASAERWDACISLLAQGDHYLSVLWGFDHPRKRPPHDSLKLFLAAILLIAILLGAIFFAAPYEPKDPLWRRLFFYSLFLFTFSAAWILVRYVGRSKNSKT